MSGVWGDIVDGADVEAAVIAHLRHWLPATTDYVRRRKDPEGTKWPDGVAPVESFLVSHVDAVAQSWPEDQMPMLIAQSPGQEGDPVTEGDGTVSATYGIMLSAIASSVTMADAKELARLYASAARLALVQNPQLDAGTGEPFAEHVAMGAERNGPLRRGVETERNLMVVTTPYLIAVPSILTISGGPITAPEDPTEEPKDWPTVKEGGGSATVESLTESGFFDAKP